MNLVIIISLIFLFLIFLPIPIKISISYLEKNLQIFLFNHEIKLNKIKSKNNKDKNKTYKRKTNISIQNLLYKLDNIKFKSHLIIKYNLHYGLGDAANTAILYGILNAIIPFIIRFLEIIFNIKKINSLIQPNFEKFELNIKIDCILFVSMANIINVMFVILKCKHSKKAFNNIPVSS